MEKIEYSDLNKFLVSIGVTLIVVAFLLPWLYLREPFDLALTQDQISKLTRNAQTIISIRQGFILETISYIQFASFGLLVTGLISVIVGLSRWIKKQKDLDKRDKIITATHELKYKKLNEEEVAEKAEKEFFALKQDETPASASSKRIIKEDFIPKYLQLEKVFSEKLIQFFDIDFRILSNYRIDNYEYDVILEARRSKGLDYIFEIKYYPKRYSKSNLQEAVLKLEKATKSYIQKTGRQAKPILVIIVHPGDFTDKQFDDLNVFTSRNLREFKRINLGIISFDELEQLKKQQILNLLNKE